MQKRTRVMQRNVRMVLILVDGQSTVADLCLKTGNPKLTERALRDLEKSGLIQLHVEQDSLWEESKKVAQEIRAAAINKAFQTPVAANTDEVATAPEARIFVHSGFPPLPRDPSMSHFSVAPVLEMQITAENMSSELIQDGAKKSPKRESKQEKKADFSFIKRIKELLLKRYCSTTDDFVIKHVRQGARVSVGWPLIGVFSIFGFLAIVFMATLLFPYERYLPEVEAFFSQESGRPVMVGGMHVRFYPAPGLILDDVRIGSGKEDIRISEIRLQPELSTLASSKIIFRQISVSGIKLPVEFIAGLPSVFEEAAKPVARAGFKHVSFENTELSFGGLGLSALKGETILSAEGLFLALSLQTPDRSLSLEVKPVEKRIDVTMEGFSWRSSPNSSFPFDSVNLKASIENEILTINNMELRIFDGLIKAVATIPAKNNPTISGDIWFERINANRLGDSLGIGQQFSGETSGKIRFSATSDSWATIVPKIDAEGNFSIHRGNMRGIDLAEAVRRVSNLPVQGGATAFEYLSGKLKLDPSRYVFSGLVLTSGLMQSTGFIEVSRDLQVSGRMELQMRGTVNQTKVPVSISGPLKTPAVQVGRG